MARPAGSSGSAPAPPPQRAELLRWKPKERAPRLGTRLLTAEQEAAAAQLPEVTLDVDEFKPPKVSQRGKLLLLALLTVTVLWGLLLLRPGRTLPPPADAGAASAASAVRPAAEPATRPAGPQPCAPGQTRGCIGGQATVILLPATPGASR